MYYEPTDCKYIKEDISKKLKAREYQVLGKKYTFFLKQKFLISLQHFMPLICVYSEKANEPKKINQYGGN